MRRGDDRGSEAGQGRDRGRKAERPGQIPAAGWRDVLVRVKGELVADHIGVVAAGVAFYAFLAIFPALTAAVSIWGLVGDPEAARTHILSMTAAMPADSRHLLADQLAQLGKSSGGALGLGAAIGLLLALWSASRGVAALIEALNIAYDEEDRRSWLRRTGLTLLLTVGGVVVMLLAVGAVVVLPAVLAFLHLPGPIEGLLTWLRWPLLAIGVSLALAVVYRYGPDRTEPRWEWVSWGSVMATVIWLGVSMLLSLYVSRFGSYQKTYGSLAAVIILLLWLLLSSYSILVGAEINAELEHQTRADTTSGPPAPLGQRGAFDADTVAQTP